MKEKRRRLVAQRKEADKTAQTVNRCGARIAYPATVISQLKTISKNPAGKLLKENLKAARTLWPNLSAISVKQLKLYSDEFEFSVTAGDLIYLGRGWYVPHSGLVRLARRRCCAGIHVEPVQNCSDVRASRWAFRATAYKSKRCKGFVGYGDADPSNVSALVRGAEMRTAETRAVNRALRKAYGIGICSVEELGSSVMPGQSSSEQKRPVSPNGMGTNGQPRLRDRLCQLIRHHQLDPVLVKAYALEFCGTKTLNEATRQQIEKFIAHLADWAAKDKSAVADRLQKCLRNEEGAA